MLPSRSMAQGAVRLKAGAEHQHPLAVAEHPACGRHAAAVCFVDAVEGVVDVEVPAQLLLVRQQLFDRLLRGQRV